MKVRFARFSSRARSRCTLGLFLSLFAAAPALAQQGTPEQRRACTPDVFDRATGSGRGKTCSNGPYLLRRF